MQPVTPTRSSSEMFFAKSFRSLKAIWQLSHIFLAAQRSPQRTACFDWLQRCAVKISGWYIYVFMSSCNPPQLFSHHLTVGFVPVIPLLLHRQPNLLDPDPQSLPNLRLIWLTCRKREKMWRPFPSSSPSMKIQTFLVNCQRGRSSIQIFSRRRRGKQVLWTLQCCPANDYDRI